MPDLLLSRSDLFVVGSTVRAYAPGSFHGPGIQAGTAIEEQTVAADGTATFTTLSASTPYVFSNGSNACRQQLSTFTAGTPWKTVVANRRTAIGTS